MTRIHKIHQISPEPVSPTKHNRFMRIDSFANERFFSHAFGVLPEKREQVLSITVSMYQLATSFCLSLHSLIFI